MHKTSIITEYMTISILSGKPKECVHHCINGNSLRRLADEDGLVIPLTNTEHDLIHREGMGLSRIIGQLAWEREFYREICMKCGVLDENPAKEAFRKRYGISYL